MLQDALQALDAIDLLTTPHSVMITHASLDALPALDAKDQLQAVLAIHEANAKPIL